MSDLISKAQVIRRGWTPLAISKFLGDPDQTKRNSRNRKAPIQLFYEDRVAATENTAAWLDWKSKSKARSDAAKKSAASKREKTIDKATSQLHKVDLKPQFKNLSKQKLQDFAIKHFEELEIERHVRSGGKYTAETVTSRRSPDFIKRITVNFLRHAGTSYDSELDKYFSSIGVNQAKDIVREHVYDIIATEYPYLKGECDRQLAVRRERQLWKLGVDVSDR